MQSFRMQINSAAVDVSAMLAEALGHCGSLAATRPQWAALLQAMGLQVHSYLRTRFAPELGSAAEAITAAGTPEVAFPHPQCAEWDVDQVNHHVWFTTPGGVYVALRKEGAALELTVDFNRESGALASWMLAALARHSNDAVPLLAQASADWAAKVAA